MCLVLHRVVVESATPGWADPFLPLRLVESQSGTATAEAATFTLHDGARPVYTLTTGEIAEFQGLLQQIALAVPGRRRSGLTASPQPWSCVAP